MLRTLSGRLFTKHYGKSIVQQRFLSHYPIDETIFGLNDDQINVSILIFFLCKQILLFVDNHVSLQGKQSILQLRETIFNFAQKELAPHAQTIDQKNEFK